MKDSEKIELCVAEYERILDGKKCVIADLQNEVNNLREVEDKQAARINELLKQNDALAMQINAVHPKDSSVEELKAIIRNLEKKCKELSNENTYLSDNFLKSDAACKKLEHECIELHKENKKLKYELAEKDTPCENTCDCATGSLHYEAECERLMRLNEELQEDIKDISIERKRLRSMLNVVEMIFGGELV